MRRQPILPGQSPRNLRDINADYNSRRAREDDYVSRAQRLQAWYDRRSAHWKRIVERITRAPVHHVPPHA